jgi:hypothetical protein
MAFSEKEMFCPKNAESIFLITLPDKILPSDRFINIPKREIIISTIYKSEIIFP